ncbi:MAG TPA: methyltransferase domain-containing protein [Tepidisphaeraceae bacterium]|jgi:tRNA (cmo5U34)-methyltransferase
MSKSTVEQIRQRFDNDVERFSNLETGQAATIDAPLVLDLITSAAAAVTPGARSVLDVGCGAGNYTIKLLGKLPGRHATLIDLSQPMLDRAVQRVEGAGATAVTPLLGDIRELPLPEGGFDVILAAAVLHHLRTEAEWEGVFAKLYRSLRSGGSLWISDLVEHSTPRVQQLMWNRYGEYLASLRDESYRDHVFAYVEQEDTPRPLMEQLDLLRRVGFARVEVLHKNGPFAAFGGMRT